MFVDYTKIYVRAGNGGDGAVSFHREKYVAAGGPDGGDGGDGGNVFVVASKHLNTLMDFKRKKKFTAENGENGRNKNMTGKSGADLYIEVPFGTLIREAKSNRIIKDIVDETPFLLAKGGRGGWGNAKFSTSTRQIPRFSKAGVEGEEFEIVLELKVIADIGLLGYPNAGKSTLLSVISAAKPKIADYPFTTIHPNLGVVKLDDERSFVVADIPGIIENASEGAGLGHRFLRHVERCRFLLHLVDVSEMRGIEPAEAIDNINRELEKFSKKLAEKQQIIVGTKLDAADREYLAELKKEFEAAGRDIVFISAATREGLDELLEKCYAKIEELPPSEAFESEYEPETAPETVDKFTVRVEKGVFYVEGDWIKRLLESTNTEDYESLMNFQKILQKEGVFDALERMGIREKETVDIYGFEFEFLY